MHPFNGKRRYRSEVIRSKASVLHEAMMGGVARVLCGRLAAKSAGRLPIVTTTTRRTMTILNGTAVACATA